MRSQIRYQQYAYHCLRSAVVANGDKERGIFLEMADAWTQVALVVRDVSRQNALDASAVKRRLI